MASVKRIERKSGPRWKVIWRDKTGHQWTQTFSSEYEAKNKAITVEADKIRGKAVDKGQRKQPYGTLAKARLRARRNLTPKVRGGYRGRLDRQVLPYWGKVRIENIDADSVSRWVEECEKQGLSEWTILEAFTVMSASFSWAVSVRKLDENPLRGLRGCSRDHLVAKSALSLNERRPSDWPRRPATQCIGRWCWSWGVLAFAPGRCWPFALETFTWMTTSRTCG